MGVYIGHDKEECYSKNWMKIYHDIEKLFESWKRRKLTLFGKSCIVKTLAISKLIYVASILTIPDNTYIKKIQRLIYNFIWNKTERIKRNVLIGTISNGGLSIVDIESKLKALKAAWVPRLLKTKSVLYNIFESYCKQMNITVPYVLCFSDKKIENLKLEKLPLFYRQMLCSFNECKVYTLDNISADVILQQPIWNNCNFLYKGNTLFFKNWLSSGVLYVKDLLDNGGNLKQLSDFSNCIRNKSNWLCEFKIISDVFKRLCKKYDFSNCNFINIQHTYKFLFYTGFVDVREKKCNFFYENFVNKKFCKPYYQRVLNTEFMIESVEWKYIYQCKLLDIPDKHLSEFNYKLLNNILCNNVFLSKWKRDTHSNCENCHIRETTKHIIFECENVVQVWNALSNYLNLNVKWKHIMDFFMNEIEKLNH